MKIMLTSLIALPLILCFSNLVHAKTVRDFVPQGWDIFQSAVGDLTSDGIADAVILIQPKNLNQQDRKLLFLQQIQGSYSLLATRDLPAYTYEADCNADFFDGSSLKIANQVLSLTFHDVPACMNTHGSSYTYRFKLKNEQFYLIGYDSSYLNKLTGENVDQSVNLSTYKMKIITTSNAFEAPNQKKEQWKNIEQLQYTLDGLSFDTPLSFE